MVLLTIRESARLSPIDWGMNLKGLEESFSDI